MSSTRMNSWRSHSYRWSGCIGMLYDTIDYQRECGNSEKEIWGVYSIMWHGYMNCLSNGGAIWNDYTSMMDVKRNARSD
jgi:phospholipase C